MFGISDMLEFYECKYPIILGPMAWIGTWELVSEVINCGGAGYLGTGNGDASYTQEQINKMKEAVGDKAFGVNLLSTNPHLKEVIEVILKKHKAVKYVSLSAFLRPPKNIVTVLKEKGIKVIARIGNKKFIPLWDSIGALSFDAEGNESGGHIGPKNTRELLKPAVEEAAKLGKFVVSAGGIYDNTDYKWALEQGAVGVVLGSRFAVSKPCIAHQNYKKMVLKASGNCTMVTGDTIRHSVRALRNKFTEHFEALEKELNEKVKNGEIFNEERQKHLEESGTGAMKRGLIDGDTENGSLMIGSVASRITKINETIPEIFKSVLNEGYMRS